MIKTPHKTFTPHVHNWTDHTPGDPMPCRPEDKVCILMRIEQKSGAVDRQSLPASRVIWRTIPGCEDAEVVGWCFEASHGKVKPFVTKTDQRLRMSGDEARTIILNCHRLLGKTQRFRGVPLWGLVSQVTGHGSGFSADICVSANLDPQQKCGVKSLVDFKGVRP
jgi:hypothetical protein